MIANRTNATHIATSEHANRDFRPLLRATGRLGNRAPIVVDDSYSTVNGGYVLRAGVGSRTSTPSVLANDSDVEGNRINVSLVTDVQNGSLSLEPDGSFTYVANTDFVGTDQFVYRADDGVDAVDGTVTITVEESQTYFIETEHDARVSERFRTTNYQNGTTIPINDDDDGDGDYEHAYFKFPISEIEGNLSEVFLDFTPTTLGGSSVTLSLYGTATDWNESSITYQEQPAIGSFAGSVSVTSTNTRQSIDVTRYVRAAVSAGDTEVSFRMIANRTNATHIATSEHANRDFRPLLRATGRLGNRAPIVVDDSYSTVNGGYVLRAGVGSRTSTPSVLANDSDVEGNRINVSLVTDVQNGSLSLEPDGSFTYIANTDFVGTDQFVYRADDGVGCC